MSQQDDFRYFQPLTTSTTVRPWNAEPKDEEPEYDDTAPLPLLIGIGLTLFIGFVILILICCCCRIRRPPADSSAAHASQANYQRAPLADGMGGGMAYPLTSLPPETGFPNASIGYQAPPQMASVVKMDYGMIGSGPGTDGIHQVPQTQLKQQPPHFGGVPTFPQAQYIASSYTPNAVPSYVPGQRPAVSYTHSSQASSSSASEAAADNMHSQGVVRALGPPGFPYQQQKGFPGQGFQYQIVPQQPFHPMMPPPGLTHQQQQQLYMTGRSSPAVMMHPDGQIIGKNFIGNINQQHQVINSPGTIQNLSQPPSASDNGGVVRAGLEDHPTSTVNSTPVTVNTGSDTAAATDASHQQGSEEISPSTKLLSQDESDRRTSDYSKTDGEEE
ncbi:hypothetical protein RRG08_012793 [Elysia crispata]|uniref:Uncharacterized protein n=1 Tax=Elysia crispata TaxID=231223 RepID=A0AAE0ZRR5_9GAST|nr:hypothetical protein RRG08_012793 [Elysia crispata]